VTYCSFSVCSVTYKFLDSCHVVVVGANLLYLCLVGPQTARLATTTLTSSQPDSNLVNAPSPLPDRASGSSCPLTSKSLRTLVFSGANLGYIFFIFVSIPLAHTNIVLCHQSFVGDNIDSVLLCCINREHPTGFLIEY